MNKLTKVFLIGLVLGTIISGVSSMAKLAKVSNVLKSQVRGVK